MPEKTLKPITVYPPLPNIILPVLDKTQVCILLEHLLGSDCNTKAHHRMLETAGTATSVFLFPKRVMFFRYLSQ